MRFNSSCSISYFQNDSNLGLGLIKCVVVRGGCISSFPKNLPGSGTLASRNILVGNL